MDYIPIQCYCSNIGRTILLLTPFIKISTLGNNPSEKLGKKLAFQSSSKSFNSIETTKLLLDKSTQYGYRMLSSLLKRTR